MASYYLINSGGNWTDTTKWAASDVSALANINDGATPTASDDAFLTANSGQCTISAASVGKSLTCTGYTGTLTHNAFNLTISGSVTLVAGMTYTPLATSTITLAAANTLTTGGKLLPLLVLSSGTTTLGDNLSFMASKVITLILNGNNLDLNGKTVAGNSAINRVLVTTNTLGTARTITINSGTFNACDFRDITASSALDLSAASNYSGDCGGNTSITFTTNATQTSTGNSSNYSIATWTSRVPLPQDDVIISLTAGQTLTFDMPRLGKSISLTTACTLSTNTIAMTLYGSLNLTNVATFTTGSTGTWTFEGRGSFTLTSAGKNFATSVGINMIGGTLTIQDSFSSNGLTLTLTFGGFDANNFNVTINALKASNSNTRTLSMGSGTWTVTGNGQFPGIWDIGTTTGLTFNKGTSTIVMSDTTIFNAVFNGANLTYYNLTYNAPNASGKSTNGGTFNTVTIIAPMGGLAFNGNMTVTNFIARGSPGNTIVLSGNVIKSSGTVSCNYLNLTSSAASGGAKFYAGANSTNSGGNSGWLFKNAPSGSFGGSGFGLGKYGASKFGMQAYSI